jgi:hypothetical protein
MIKDRPEAASGSSADQNRAGHGDRRAKAGGSFEERAERKRDQQLQASVLVTPPTARFNSSNWPVATGAVRKITFSMIQLIGKKPATTPSSDADRHARWHGEDEDRDQIGQDHCNDGSDMRFDLPLAISTSSVINGTAAAIVDSAALPSGL